MNSENEQLDIVDLLLFAGIGVPVMFGVTFVTAVIMKAAGMQAVGARLLIAQFVGYTALIAVLSWIVQVRHGVTAMSLLRMRVTAKEASTSLSLGVLTSLGVAAAAALLQTPKEQTPMEELLADPLSLGLAAVLGSTVGPMFEEILFRGILQTALARYIGAVLAVVASAFLFSLMHGPQYGWSWRHVVLITCAGAAFGFRRLATNSTGAAAVMHGAYNMVLFVALIAGKNTSI